jgi:hypothetical protein
MRGLRRVVVMFGLSAVVGMLGGCAHAPAPGSPTRPQLEHLLATVRVVAARRHVPGYDRSCESGHACVFGPAWSDDTDAPGGHNGCGTRNDVLAAQLSDVVYRFPANRCVVAAGQLADPYTGKQIRFRKQDARAVQIDHVYPLAAAWDMGAAQWPPRLRARFANDIDYNLLAVDGTANQDKGDKTPSNWLPPNRTYHCYYVGKYLSAAQHYGLPITRADRRVMAKVARSCG